MSERKGKRKKKSKRTEKKRERESERGVGEKLYKRNSNVASKVRQVPVNS